MKRSIDEPRGFIERVRPAYDGLFQCAYVLTGNLELAEYVLRSALLAAYLRRGEWRERMSFQEGVFYALRVVALTELRRIRAVGGYEVDWALPSGADLLPAESALLGRLERESVRTQRLMLLLYGCGLKANEAAQALSLSVPGVREAQRRLLSRLMRASKMGRRETEARLESLSDKLLAVPCLDAPAFGMVVRSFERDAHGQTDRKASAARVAGTAFLAAAALLCAVLFWVLTVLLEPRTVTPATTSAPYAQEEPISSTNSG